MVAGSTPPCVVDEVFRVPPEHAPQDLGALRADPREVEDATRGEPARRAVPDSSYVRDRESTSCSIEMTERMFDTWTHGVQYEDRRDEGARAQGGRGCRGALRARRLHRLRLRAAARRQELSRGRGAGGGPVLRPPPARQAVGLYRVRFGRHETELYLEFRPARSEASAAEKLVW